MCTDDIVWSAIFVVMPLYAKHSLLELKNPRTNLHRKANSRAISLHNK